MPDTPSPIIHFRGDSLGTNACGPGGEGERSWNPGEVTCFACRKTPAFKQAQMPDTPSTTTLIHFVTPGSIMPVCGAGSNDEWHNIPGRVTCFACRKTPEFKQAQRVDAVVAQLPIKLSGVMADDAHLSALREEAEEKFDLLAMRNHRNMFTIEEVIHHGQYRSIRNVEVFRIDATTVDAVLQSSAYCYGSWLHADPPHTEHRRAALHQLVEDLRHGRTNRSIGWSTFRLV